MPVHANQNKRGAHNIWKATNVRTFCGGGGGGWEKGRVSERAPQMCRWIMYRWGSRVVRMPESRLPSQSPQVLLRAVTYHRHYATHRGSLQTFIGCRTDLVNWNVNLQQFLLFKFTCFEFMRLTYILIIFLWLQNNSEWRTQKLCTIWDNFFRLFETSFILRLDWDDFLCLLNCLSCFL